MLQRKIDIDTSVPSVAARTTRPLLTTAVKPRTEASRSSNSNSFCQPCFLCSCTDRLELTAGQCRQLGQLSNFQKATENSPFLLRHVKRSCHRAPLHFLLWRYTSFIIVLYCIVKSQYKPQRTCDPTPTLSCPSATTSGNELYEPW